MSIGAQNNSSVANGSALALITADKASSAGATGAFGLTKTASDQHTLLVFALKPQPAGGGPTATPRSSGTII